MTKLVALFETHTVQVKRSAEKCDWNEYTFKQNGPVCYVTGETHAIMMLIGIRAAQGYADLVGVVNHE